LSNRITRRTLNCPTPFYFVVTGEGHVVAFLFFLLLLWILLSFVNSKRHHSRIVAHSSARRRRSPATEAAGIDGEIVFIKSLNSRYHWMNSTGIKLMARSEDEIVGASDADLFPADRAEQHVLTDRQVLQSGRAQVYMSEEQLGNQRRTLLVHKMPWRDNDGRVIGVIGIATAVAA
jgi:hypothetical protein